MEEWKTIKGYEGIYEVSNYGRIKSLSRPMVRIGAYVSKEIYLKLVKSKRYGYLNVTLCNANKIGKQKRIHQIVVEAFIGDVKIGYQINHIDGNKENNKLCNLEIITASENIKHAYKTGLIGSNEDHPRAKFSNEKIIEMRNLFYNRKYTCRQLSEINGVNNTTMNRILNGTSYKGVLGVMCKKTSK